MTINCPNWTEGEEAGGGWGHCAKGNGGGNPPKDFCLNRCRFYQVAVLGKQPAPADPAVLARIRQQTSGCHGCGDAPLPGM